MLEIEHTTTTVYQSQSNGGCERLNRTIIDRLGMVPRRSGSYVMFVVRIIMVDSSSGCAVGSGSARECLILHVI